MGNDNNVVPSNTLVIDEACVPLAAPWIMGVCKKGAGISNLKFSLFLYFEVYFDCRSLDTYVAWAEPAVLRLQLWALTSFGAKPCVKIWVFLVRWYAVEVILGKFNLKNL